MAEYMFKTNQTGSIPHRVGHRNQRGDGNTDFGLHGSVSSDISDTTESVLIVCAISCILSILGSFVIFGTYALMPEIRNFTRKLIVFLTMADFLTASGYLLGTSQYIVNNHGSDVICRVQSYITTYSSLVSFFLTMMTAYHIFTTVVKQPEFTSRRRLILFNFFSWIIPAAVIALAGSQDVIGGSPESTGTGPWCWIKPGTDHEVPWQLATGKFWEILCYLVTTSLYVLLKLYLFIRHRHERFRTFHASLRDEDQNFLYVWFIFYLIRIWGTLRFFISAIRPGTSPDALYMRILLYMQAFGDPAQAFCNSVLFCFMDETVRRRLCSRCSDNVCNNRELREPTAGDNESLISEKGSENEDQDSPRVRDPLNYGSTNSSRDDREHSRSCTYDSPLSTPCFTPRLSPASFRSTHSDS